MHNKLENKSRKILILQIQAFTAMFMSSIFIFGIIIYVIKCVDAAPLPTDENEATQELKILFYIGLAIVAAANWLWSQIFNRYSGIMKSVFSNQAETPQLNFIRFFPLVLVACCITEASAILGFVILYSSGCDNQNGWLLMGLAFLTLLWHFPKKHQLEKLLKIRN